MITHAARTGQVVFWAPEKMVADAGEGANPPQDFARLVAWFASQIGAGRLIYVGLREPDANDFSGPVEVRP